MHIWTGVCFSAESGLQGLEPSLPARMQVDPPACERAQVRVLLPREDLEPPSSSSSPSFISVAGVFPPRPLVRGRRDGQVFAGD